jgi:predicted nucleotide-binding protein
MMTDIEKFKKLTKEIDVMLPARTDPSSEEFTSWRTKVERLLDRIYGTDSKEAKKFRNTLFWSPVYIGSMDADQMNIDACHNALESTRAIFNVYIEELEENQTEEPDQMVQAVKGTSEMNNYKKVFIVHGHDGELKQKVARLLEKQGIEAVILSEQPNQGMTIIEKIEAYSEGVDAAICLFTPDDEMKDGSKRARENVVLETGYFIGKIGREKTIVVAAEGVMNLSDLKGIVYVSDKNWELDVLKELREIGYSVDFNKL